MSPLKVLGRGYAIPRNKDGVVIRSIEETVPGDEITVRVADGEIPCIVKGSLSDG